MDQQSILDELRSISERLSELSPGATNERSRLLARRAELRDLAADTWGGTRPREEVVAELRHLEELRNDLLAHGHVDPVRQSGGGAGGGFGFTADAWTLNRKIDEAHDREGLEHRIRELRAALDDAG